jgi:tRNA G10  N-methylase Trm11
MQYYSTFPIGFSDLVKEILLTKDSGVEIHSKGDNYIFYSSKLNIEEIKGCVFFEQSFYIIKFFDKKGYEFKNQIHWIKSNVKLLEDRLSVLGNNKRFRMVGTSTWLDKSKIQEEIDNIYGLKCIDNRKPDYDIRIIEKEDYGFIGVRVTKPAEYSDSIQKGSLRKEIAYYMLFMSEVDKEDILLDPFCGGGVIPLLRKSMGKYKSIYCSDISIKDIRTKIEGDTNLQSFEIIESDIYELRKKLETKVNKIVTDPPWGAMSKLDSIQKFYFDMLDIFYSISNPNSLVILLTPHIEIVNSYIESNKEKYTILNTYTGKVSGLDSNIIKLKRF